MATIGTIALFLALGVAAYSIIVSVSRLMSNSRNKLAAPIGSIALVCGLLTLTVLVLLIALVTHNFSLEYVASYTSTTMSLPYILSALWAGNGGSLLFWAWLLTIFSLIFVLQKKNRESPLLAYASPVLMLTVLFFTLLLLATTNPFATLATPPTQGQGLNPQLQNPGMIFHPPFLLAGYVGFTIPFALAVAALFSRRFDDAWLASARRWTLFSWLLLGIGNLIGAWWAYVELGWGGYWAWDPVENAGLMPWLVATAFIHSLIMQKRRGTFKVWAMVLIILTFNLTIFGTFMTRGGFSPVHSWQDTGMAPYFITFLAITLFVPLNQLISHRKKLKGKEEIADAVSREGAFLLNNILLAAITLVTLIGSVVPAILKLIQKQEVSVNQSYFNMVDSPLLLGVILLAGLCAVIGWRKMTGRELWRRFLLPLVFTVVLGIILLVLKVTHPVAVIGYMLSAFTLLAVASQWLHEIGAAGKRSLADYPAAFWRLLRANRPRYGAYIVHVSLTVMAIGIIGSSLFDVSQEATLAKGESLTIKDYVVQYDDVVYAQKEDNDVIRATVTVTRNGQSLGALYPEKLYSASYDQWVSEVAIRSTLSEDLYVILADWQHDASSFKVLVNPLVNWIWIGGGLFMLGGLIAFWPGREMPAVEQPAAGQKTEQTPSRPASSGTQPPKPATGNQPARTPTSPVNVRKKRARHGKRR